MFSKDGLKYHLKRRKQFFEENMDFARETSLDRSKTWVDNNIRFSTSILCTKKIITARRIDILGLNLTMNKVLTNCGLSGRWLIQEG